MVSQWPTVWHPDVPSFVVVILLHLNARWKCPKTRDLKRVRSSRYRTGTAVANSSPSSRSKGRNLREEGELSNVYQHGTIRIGRPFRDVRRPSIRAAASRRVPAPVPFLWL